MFVLMSYDVEARRTGVFRKIMRRYLGHEQFSVFFGELTKSELMSLRAEIRSAMNPDDSIFEVVAENRHNVDVFWWKQSGYSSALPRKEEDVRHKTSTEVI